MCLWMICNRKVKSYFIVLYQFEIKLFDKLLAMIRYNKIKQAMKITI